LAEPRKVSPTMVFFYIIGALIVLFIAIISIYAAYAVLSSSQASIEEVGYYLLIGTMMLLLSAYLMGATRRKTTIVQNIIPQDVLSIDECAKCGFKNVRTFVRGDYVFKTSGKCPKCSETMSTAAIYREEKTRR
jgi:Zn ribbon nucleic-acid-binding protein